MVGCPIRFSFGGVGSIRFLGVKSEPASWKLRKEVTAAYRNVNLAELGTVGARGNPDESLPQRAKKPRSGGNMVAVAFSSGLPRHASKTWSPRTASETGVGAAPCGESGGQP